jgi:3-phosphoshikimate 1-carboxyvinyltransferase
MSGILGSATVPRVVRVRGSIRVPGDKSISHRYALLAAIADGVSQLHGYLPGADCAATLACLEACGVAVARAPGADGVDLTIHGRGVRGLAPPAAALDAANSGTTMRLLAGVLSAHRFTAIIEGDASLSRRPMRRVIDPLARMGARIRAVDGRPPLTIDGGDLHGITHVPDVPSAQVKSAVLLAGLQADGRTAVREPVPTRDHTERALEAFGARLERDGASIAVEGGQRLTAIEAVIPGDISSAVFWLVLAAATPRSSLLIEAVGLNPSRSHVLDVLRRAGAIIETVEHRTVAGEPLGMIHVRAGEPRAVDISPAEVPAIIDEIPALAALAAMTDGGALTVRGAGELRVKESDRIAMLARGFRAIGVEVDEYEDGFSIRGGPPRGGMADAAGDHRLAMAFAIAGTRARDAVRIAGAESVAVSYPAFFDDLERFAGER